MPCSAVLQSYRLQVEAHTRRPPNPGADLGATCIICRAPEQSQPKLLQRNERLRYALRFLTKKGGLHRRVNPGRPPSVNLRQIVRQPVRIRSEWMRRVLRMPPARLERARPYGHRPSTCRVCQFHHGGMMCPELYATSCICQTKSPSCPVAAHLSTGLGDCQVIMRIGAGFH